MSKGLKVKSQVKVGGTFLQHSEEKGLRVRTSVKAGGWSLNHSEQRGRRVRTRVNGTGRVRAGVAALGAVAALGIGGVVVDGAVRPAPASACPIWQCGFNHSEAGARRVRGR